MKRLPPSLISAMALLATIPDAPTVVPRRSPEPPLVLTPMDVERLEAARQKRARRAAKRNP